MNKKVDSSILKEVLHKIHKDLRNQASSDFKKI